VSESDETLWDLVLGSQQAVLATIAPDGLPQLSNVLYVIEPETRLVRISTTATRIKTRNLAREPRGVLHVSSDNFWAYAVASGTATLSKVATEPGDEACRELLAVHTAFYGDLAPDAFYAEMIANQRLVIRLHLQRVYGIVSTTGRRPQGTSGPAATT
jgi:PPOX class probable F420-dependent enzyme